MTALAHRPAAFEVRGLGTRAARDRGPNHLVLLASGDGWSLLDQQGQVVFRGFGLGGRRECLEFARDRGILAVFSR